MTLTTLTFLMILGRCTILIYLVFCVPILLTILFFIFKNDTSLSNSNRELFFKNFNFGGHRGSPEKAPENSIQSFAKAKEDGCDLVEFDIHMSSDGVALIMHDDTTGRTGNLNLKVEETKWEHLEGIDLKPVSNVTAKIPTLIETIDWCVENGMKMLFDMKNDNLILMEMVAEEIKKRNIYDRVMVSSFNPIVPWRLKKIDPRIITGVH
uniref:GP-PDE domain-containing protein n=1 Tax=Caenorhabditis tropicalis TaxID=1561998 RepID=A0A1I7TPA2_9PELO